MTSSNVGTGDVAGQAGGDPADLMRRIGELIAEFANKALGQLSDPARAAVAQQLAAEQKWRSLSTSCRNSRPGWRCGPNVDVARAGQASRRAAGAVTGLAL